ncbi:transcriptional regulator [Nocardia acididurans]|uniref:transcriptional regulator n=1 Tax=Nocardia acididurans TaxID=2802282 RepID=UPI001E519203|nr:transcriptional regulator [Nocardia acididurans]
MVQDNSGRPPVAGEEFTDAVAELLDQSSLVDPTLQRLRRAIPQAVVDSIVDHAGVVDSGTAGTDFASRLHRRHAYRSDEDLELLTQLQAYGLRRLSSRAYDLSEESQNLLTTMADKLRASEGLPAVPPDYSER